MPPTFWIGTNLHFRAADTRIFHEPPTISLYKNQTLASFHQFDNPPATRSPDNWQRVKRPFELLCYCSSNALFLSAPGGSDATQA